MNEVNESCDLVINYINSLLKNYNQKMIVLDFFISHNYLFLETEYKNGANKVIVKKNKLTLDLDDIDKFYLELYQRFKEQFVENDFIRVQIIKEIDFSNFDNPYLSLKVHDIHLNEINLRLRDLGNLKNTLNIIEDDILALYKEKRKVK